MTNEGTGPLINSATLSTGKSGVTVGINIRLMNTGFIAVPVDLSHAFEMTVI